MIPSSVSSETSSGSDEIILQVRRRTHCLGLGLESDEAKLCWEWEPESDEHSSSEGTGAAGAADLLSMGIFTAAPGLTSTMGTEGF